MIVCVCHGVSDRELRKGIEKGARCVGELGAGDRCGTCIPTVCNMIRDLSGGELCSGCARGETLVAYNPANLTHEEKRSA